MIENFINKHYIAFILISVIIFSSVSVLVISLIPNNSTGFIYLTAFFVLLIIAVVLFIEFIIYVDNKQDLR